MSSGTEATSAKSAAAAAAAAAAVPSTPPPAAGAAPRSPQTPQTPLAGAGVCAKRACAGCHCGVACACPDEADAACGCQPKTAIFSIRDEVGALEKALDVFHKHNINLTRIESRPSRARPDYDYDFYVDFVGELGDAFVAELRARAGPLVLLDSAASARGGTWFPRKIADLDQFANKVLDAGAELEADHPGFKDAEYRKRRTAIVEIARTYRHGRTIPRVKYSADEVATWGVVYRKLRGLYAAHACAAFNNVLPLLEKHCGYAPDNIPQLEDISRFLKDCTGFTLRPVQGLLSARDFLNGLAFRVFHATQYIRHSSKPLYTPEPDVCHELLGHVPLFADADFARFSQEIGLASLGASDAFIEQLATCYWFTVEFGLCREHGERKAYGAGLLSSFGELEYCMSDKPVVKPFEPAVAAVTKYPITSYQPTYFVADSFADATRRMREFAASSDRPFHVRYNAYTQSVEVLDSSDKLARMADNLSSELATLAGALRDMS